MTTAAKNSSYAMMLTKLYKGSDFHVINTGSTLARGRRDSTESLNKFNLSSDTLMTGVSTKLSGIPDKKKANSTEAAKFASITTEANQIRQKNEALIERYKSIQDDFIVNYGLAAPSKKRPRKTRSRQE